MNARLYDPLLGRFTSPDSVVDGALNLQGYNRYSYGQNSPTGGVDQSNAESYLALPNVFAVGGSWVMPRGV